MDFPEILPKYVGIIEKDKYKFWVSSDQGGHGENLISNRYGTVFKKYGMLIFRPIGSREKGGFD